MKTFLWIIIVIAIIAVIVYILMKRTNDSGTPSSFDIGSRGDGFTTRYYIYNGKYYKQASRTDGSIGTGSPEEISEPDYISAYELSKVI